MQSGVRNFCCSLLSSAARPMTWPLKKHITVSVFVPVKDVPVAQPNGDHISRHNMKGKGKKRNKFSTRGNGVHKISVADWEKKEERSNIICSVNMKIKKIQNDKMISFWWKLEGAVQLYRRKWSWYFLKWLKKEKTGNTVSFTCVQCETCENYRCHFVFFFCWQ